MYSVYVLKSQINNWHYVGLTNNVAKRLIQHNSGQNRSTKHFAPFTLIHKKDFTDRISARDYKKFLKISSNKKKLIKSLKIAEVAKLVDAHA